MRPRTMAGMNAFFKDSAMQFAYRLTDAGFAAIRCPTWLDGHVPA